MTSTLVSCTQPGCTGTIEDGYCNVCGAPSPVGAPVAAQVGKPVSIVASSELSGNGFNGRLQLFDPHGVLVASMAAMQWRRLMVTLGCSCMLSPVRRQS